MTEVPAPTIPHAAVTRAVRLSYVQAMLSTIFATFTGGMFLIGYALKLGATNVQIGLLTTVPMLCVVAQLPAALCIERGCSRRMMTVISALLSVCGWGVIMLIPVVGAHASPAVKVGLLIALITTVTLFAQIAGSARGSWVGDLIPATFLGTFFGRSIMYAGIVGAIIGLLAGHFLDLANQQGIGAFLILFIISTAFGLLNTALYVPQADVPLPKHTSGGSMLPLVRETFNNRPLMAVMLYALLWSLQGIAGPFVATYMLRDLKLTYLGVGIITSVATLTMLIASPFWGRIVDRYGCRPVLVTCTAIIAPISLVWIWVNSAFSAYAILIPANVLCGFAVAGISVALNTLIYKVTPSAGRSMQFAIYSIIVVLGAAPMPTIGGYLPGWIHAIGLPGDLRVTFYAAIPFVAAAALAARFINEPAARNTRELVRNLPAHLRHPRTLPTA